MCFKFCPTNPNIIAGGCISGQVVLWDISQHADRLKLSSTASKAKDTLGSLVKLLLIIIITWFLRSGEVRESQEKSRRSGEVREFKSTMVQKLTKMQKKTELLHAHCIQQFKIFSARFARRLFILLLFHLFCRPSF